LPGRNGYRICADLRRERNWTPILMLTAKDGELDEAEALETGTDDFLSKPFSYVMLVARLRALLRRGRPSARPCQSKGRGRAGRRWWLPATLADTGEETALVQVVDRSGQVLAVSANSRERTRSHRSAPALAAWRRAPCVGCPSAMTATRSGSSR